MRKIQIFCLLLLLFNPLVAKKYLKPNYYGNNLVIVSPEFKKDGENEIYYAKDNRSLTVKLTYQNYYIQTNRAEFSNNKVSLSNKFKLTVQGDKAFNLSGQRVIYNLKKSYFDAADIFMERNQVYFRAKRFSFYGSYIKLWEPAIGAATQDDLQMIKSVDLSFQEITAYPGLTNGKHILLKISSIPIFYAYNAVIDERFGPYKIQTPLPEFGKTTFRGKYWQENINFLINEKLYGNFYFGNSEKTGVLYGWQQVARLSDSLQFYYHSTNFSNGHTQEKISATYLFIDKKRPKNYHQAVKYYEERRNNGFPGFAWEYLLNNEIQDSLIDIKPHIYMWQSFSLPYNWILSADGGSQKITEYLYDPTNNTKSKTGITASKYYLDFDLNKRLFDFFNIGLDYNTSQYDLDPYGWYRMSDYLDFGFKIPFTKIKFSAKLVDYLYQKGGSPFEYDKVGINFDSAQLKYKVSFWKLVIIYQDIFDMEKEILFTSKYHVEYREGVWVLLANYDTRKEEFNVSISIKF